MASDGVTGPRVEEDDLYSYFNKSVSAVQAHADEFERSFARPALATSQAFFDERPIAATFIAIFSLLSFLPVVAFIAFALFAIVSFSVAALSFAFLASVAVIFSLLSLLILTLLTTFTSSLFLTMTTLFAYAFYRLFILVRQFGTDGIPHWIGEIREALTYGHSEVKMEHVNGDEDPYFEDIREFPVDVKEEIDTSSELQPSTRESGEALNDEIKAEAED